MLVLRLKFWFFLLRNILFFMLFLRVLWLIKIIMMILVEFGYGNWFIVFFGMFWKYINIKFVFFCYGYVDLNVFF